MEAVSCDSSQMAPSVKAGSVCVFVCCFLSDSSPLWIFLLEAQASVSALVF